jgi:hypothetical protein
MFPLISISSLFINIYGRVELPGSFFLFLVAKILIALGEIGVMIKSFEEEIFRSGRTE